MHKLFFSTRRLILSSLLLLCSFFTFHTTLTSSSGYLANAQISLNSDSHLSSTSNSGFKNTQLTETEHISQFISKITINQDTSITINELITYHTPQSKHGIFRYIPTTYTKNGLIEKISLSNIEVTEITQTDTILIDDFLASNLSSTSDTSETPNDTSLFSSKPVPYEVIQDGAFFTLKIGDPNTTFDGTKIYSITYTAFPAIEKFISKDQSLTEANTETNNQSETEAISSLADPDNSIQNSNSYNNNSYHELYWDITGEGWSFPIYETTTLVISPYAEITELACFTGTFGTSDNACTFDLLNNEISNQKYAIFTYTQAINYGDNKTIAVKLNPDNDLVFPSRFQSYLSLFLYNWAVLLVQVPLLVLFIWWYTKGRDYSFLSPNVFNLDATQPSKQVWPSFFAREPFVYSPIKELSPGQAGTLLRGSAKIEDVIAEILELARKKYLSIASSKKKSVFGLRSQTDYEFTSLKDNEKVLDTTILSTTQKLLFEALFKNKTKVSVSSLRGNFYTTIQAALTSLETSLVNQKVYTSKPSKMRSAGFLIASILTVCVSAFLAIQYFEYDIFWPVLLVLVQTPFTFLFALLLPQKTAIGTNLWLQTRGLRKSIRYGAWREKIKEKNLFIEEVLPFAVSLGVVHKLAKHMKDLKLKPPSYLDKNMHAPAGLGMIETQAFVQQFSKDVGSSLSYNPQSSSSSSGSGFSGGSSGGGRGGGGGGSW